MIASSLVARLLAVCGFLCLIVPQAAGYGQNDVCENARYEHKPRVFIMTDVSNEPDDQMSLVRLMAHANELAIQNIAVVTSTWKNDSIDTPSTFGVIHGYGEVIDNLNSNVPEAGAYPPAEDLAASVVTGHTVYGLAALDEPSLSNASIALINATDASEEPLWVLAWGGANVLAEALNEVKNSRSAEDIASFVKKLRVYSISDQDDSGPWIRWNFPTLFYIVSIHGFSEYAAATWIVSHSHTVRYVVIANNVRVSPVKRFATSTKVAPIPASSPMNGYKRTFASDRSANTISIGLSRWKVIHRRSWACFPMA
jgi:hypothetical protein